MTDKIITNAVLIVTGIITVAIIAVIVSQKSATANVLTAGGNAFSSILKSALSPVSGGSGLGSFTNFGSSNFGSLSTLD